MDFVRQELAARKREQVLRDLRRGESSDVVLDLLRLQDQERDLNQSRSIADRIHLLALAFGYTSKCGRCGMEIIDAAALTRTLNELHQVNLISDTIAASLTPDTVDEDIGGRCSVCFAYENENAPQTD